MGELGHIDNVTDELQNLSISGQSGAGGLKPAKDPRIIARRYQIDLCKKALDENVIVYLETGCGKTHIAVLLMYEMSSRIMKPQKEICVFLAPTVALVEQQSRVIQNSLDFKVGTYCGNSKHLKSHHDWEKELEKHEVLVMTPQILLHNLSHCYIKIQLIALLIFDECHYAQSESNHPYAEIMKLFYKPDVKKLPRIFGMTASPKHGKGASITSLESLLHSKVYSVEDREELEQFVSSPKVNVYYYGTATSSDVSPLINHSAKLEEIKHEYVSTLSRQIDDHNSIKSIRRDLQRLHSHLLFCLENLGLWGVLQASRILLKGDHSEGTALIEADGQCSDNALCGGYLAQVASVFHAACANGNGCEADLSSMEALTVPFFSRKLLRLVGILSNFRVQPDMKCIIFVNRIITARSLSYILGKLRILSSWRCDFLVGVHSGLKSMSRKSTNTILDKFRTGELNLLVATKVGEEGLDIQTCCLVIRFDIPETVASFIQSRGRARMPQSEYALLVDRGNQKEMDLIHNLQRDEAQMNEEISSQTSAIKFVDFKERTYKVDSTGATISSGTSISLLHKYCSKLPHDEYFNPKPQFFYFDDVEGTICHMILPANAPMHQIVSAPQSSMEMAKKDVCLKACKELHAVGALTDYLLPDQDNEVDNTGEDISDSDCDDEGYSRRELHEMLVPSIFREPLIGLGSTTTRLSSYFIKFKPNPDDRIYKEFGLFVKAPLPGEAERMKLDLHLARGRLVMTELVPCRVVDLIEDQVILGKKFQEMCLKVILDRSDFISDFVSLGQDDPTNLISSTFYLMLPVIIHEYEGVMSMDIDWELVCRCLSSPIFRNPATSQKPLVSHPTKWLHLVNGPVGVEDVVNSLVYVQCRNIFYFVSDIVPEKNGYSSYNASTNHIEHYVQRYKVQLSHPYQPLLKAKQLFNLDNLLRKKGYSESREKEEHFVELPAEICQLKIIGFSKDIGSSLSLLPSIMHRLESLLVAVELKNRLAASFPEGSEVAADRILEALTTENCNEHFSLERLEVLGDAFLKFAVGRHLFLLYDTIDEGQLTRKRSNMVNNSNLFKLAVANNLHVYVRDQPFTPCYFFALGRRCSVICTDDTKGSIHSSHESNLKGGACAEVRCNKCHHWLQKKTVADVVEALVGAYIVDSGFKAATAFLKWIGILVDFDASQVTKICEASKNFIPLGAQIDIASLEDLLGYQFQRKGLLLQAFVHPSYNYHSGGCYQRLEFLGDAVLDYLITSYLYSVYPDLTPGQLTDLRSASVSNNSFADVAVNRCFHNFILCDSSSLTESMNKYADLIKTASSQENLVDAASCPKALGDLVESCIGAILLDTGFDLKLVWRIMLRFLDHVMKFSSLQISPIRELQELCQCYNWDMKFSSQKKDGVFSVEVKVDIGGVSETATGTNINRKYAKRLAAKHLCSTLKDRGYKTKTKSLEEVLKSCSKKKAKLIGFNEIPILLKESENLLLQESSLRNNFQKVHPVTIEPKKNSTPNVKHSRQPVYECHSSILLVPKTNEESGLNADLQTKGGQHKVSAKSHLYEVCAGNCWKPPVFECCKETGPSHLKEFIFKVVVEMEEDSDMTFECTGEPRAKKKDAAESAAQGAIWYLKRKGYLLPED